MSGSSFGRYLKSKIKNKSRVHLLNELSNAYADFFQLDSVTLSRWINEKTVPSVHKQLLICNYFGDNIYEFIQKYLALNVRSSKNLERIKSNFYKEIEPTYNADIYSNILNEKRYIRVKKYKYGQLDCLFSIMYQNFEQYSKYHDVRDKFASPEAKRVLFYEENTNGEMRSHAAITYDHTKKFLTKYMKDSLNIKIDESNVILCELAHYSNRNSVEKILAYIIKFYIDNGLVNYTVYFISRGDKMREFAMSLGATPCGAIVKDREKLYPMKIEILKLISSPFVIGILMDNDNCGSLEYDCLEYYSD